MKLEALLLLLLASTALSNCGCLKCNKGLKVISRPCSPITIIAKESICPSGPSPKPVPYSVEIPIIETKSCERSFPVRSSAPISLCHSATPYRCNSLSLDAVAEVPVYGQQRYLNNLQTKADRIVIDCGNVAPPSPCALVELIPRHIFDKLPVLPPNELFSLLPPGVLQQLLAYPPSELIRYFPAETVRALLKLAGKSYPLDHLVELKGQFGDGVLGRPCGSPPIIEDYYVQERPSVVHRDDYLYVEGVGRRCNCPSCVSTHRRKRSLRQGQTLYSPLVSIPGLGYVWEKREKTVDWEDGKHVQKPVIYSRVSVDAVVKPPRSFYAREPNEGRAQAQSAPSRGGYLKRLRQRFAFNRHKRSLPFLQSSRHERALPFLQLSEMDEEEEIVERKPKPAPKDPFLTLFNFDHLLHHTPIFHLLNTPIRYLNQLHQLRKQVLPVVDSVPKVIRSSKNYVVDFFKQFTRNAIHFGTSIVASFVDVPKHGVSPLHLRRVRRNADDLELNVTRDNFTQFANVLRNILGNLRFRREIGDDAILNATDDGVAGNLTQSDFIEGDNAVNWTHTDVIKGENATSILAGNTISLSILIKSFLKNQKMAEEPIEHDFELAHPSLDPAEGRPARSLDELMADAPKTRPKRTILKIVDEHEVRNYLEDQLLGEVVGGQKTLVLEPLDPKVTFDKRSGLPIFEIANKRTPFDRKQDDIRDAILKIIDKAKRLSNNDALTSPQFPHTEMHTQMIKDQIKQILIRIERLVNFSVDRKFWTTIANVQALKERIVNDWKVFLQYSNNNVQKRIQLLNHLKELQALKDVSVKEIARKLLDGDHINVKKMIKLLINLQKLQCVMHRIVECFSHTSLQNLQEEVALLQQLHALRIVDSLEIEQRMREERNRELQRQIEMLDVLRSFLQQDGATEAFKTEIGLLWEMRNAEKLQQDCIAELNVKTRKGLRLRKELKILFDLQRHLDNLESKQKQLRAKIETN